MTPLRPLCICLVWAVQPSVLCENKDEMISECSFKINFTPFWVVFNHWGVAHPCHAGWLLMAFRLVLNEFSLCTMGNFNHDLSYKVWCNEISRNDQKVKKQKILGVSNGQTVCLFLKQYTVIPQNVHQLQNFHQGNLGCFFLADILGRIGVILSSISYSNSTS